MLRQAYSALGALLLAGGAVLAGSPQPQQAEPKPAKADRLRPESRLEIIRYVSGEFARAVRVLPSGKKGFRYKVGQPVDDKLVRQAAMSNGAAGNPGDVVQITRIEFRQKEIVVDINGGGKRRARLRDRIQVSVGGLPTVTATPVGGPPAYRAVGATLILDFGQPLPDISSDELKQHLGAFLDFSKSRSAAVHWVETLAPEFQQAIKERRAIVGMDREMVVAALGKPERKLRERDDDGLEIEEWIYGQPPGQTIFVRFAGEKVVSVKQYP